MHLTARIRVGLLAAAACLGVAILGMGAAHPVAGMEDGRMWAVAFAGFPVASALLLWRRPGSSIGRLLGVVGYAASSIFFLTWFAVTVPGHPFSALAEALAVGPAGTVAIGAVAAILLLFPTGQPLPVMRRAVPVFIALVAMWSVVSAVRAGPMPVTGRDNPLELEGLGWLVVASDVLALALLVVAAGTLVVRHRRGGPVERAQLRWMFSSSLLVLASSAAAGLVPPDAAPRAQLAFGVVLVAGFWSVPAAIVIAITRHRLYEIERLWSRTVSYALVAALLALVYTGSIVALQVVLPASSDLAVAGSTLAAAVLFAPLRRGVRSTLDRWFDRSRFEAEQVIAEFSTSLRHDIDLETIATRLVGTAGHTMRPAHARLWLAARPGHLGEPDPRRDG